MVAGARVVLSGQPAGVRRPALGHWSIDDAKSYFASEHQRYDLILSEPSNPWVSGVSGLFTTEFYRRVRGYLTEDGVFGQWLHAYELDDALVVSVLAAIHQNFRSYDVFLVSGGDLLVVASNRARLPRPDWSIFSTPAIRADLCRFRPFTTDALDNLRLAGRAELAALLDDYAQPNSDFYPVLDLGAEQRRYRKDFAVGFYALSADWFNLLASVTGRRAEPASDPIPALPENPAGSRPGAGRAVAPGPHRRRRPTASSIRAAGRRPSRSGSGRRRSRVASGADRLGALGAGDGAGGSVPRGKRRGRRGRPAVPSGGGIPGAAPRAGTRPRGGRVPACGEDVELPEAPPPRQTSSCRSPSGSTGGSRPTSCGTGR